MKASVPREIDDLMWALAESDNQTAVDEFIRRYPKYRPQLLKRIDTVSGLKTAKVATAPKVTVPRFDPTRPVPTDTSKLALGVAVGFGLSAVAALAYVATSLLTPDPRDTIKPAPPFHSLGPNTTVVKDPDPKTPPVVIKTAQEPVLKDDKTSDAWSKRVTLKVTDADLRTVFSLIEAQTKLQIVATEPILKKSVSAKYIAVAPMDVLESLGDKYGFTPIDQRDGTIVVIPGKTERPPRTQQGEELPDHRRTIG